MAREWRRRAGRPRPPRLRPSLDRPAVPDVQLDSLAEAGVTRDFDTAQARRAPHSRTPVPPQAEWDTAKVAAAK